MTTDNNCPKCKCENSYPDGNMWICPECFHEWDPEDAAKAALAELEASKAYDSNGNELQSGDSVSLIKDLKVKGSSSAIKSGTKVRNIRIIEKENDHNISCKVDGIGAMLLKSEFVKKI